VGVVRMKICGSPSAKHESRRTIAWAKFDLPVGVIAPQTYVYHCHIVEHEDNGMMLPFTVMP
jgi:FtsP/CotA-like multicopper oxidase with cupredoxin domain